MLRENRRVKKGSSKTRHENKTFTAKMTTGFIWTGETEYTKKENYTNMFLLRSLKPPIKCWEKIPSSLFNPHTAHALSSWCLQICVSRLVHSRARGLIPPVCSTNTHGMSPSLIHYFSPILNTGLIMAPPSLLPSAFNGPHVLSQGDLSSFSSFPTPVTLPEGSCPYLSQRTLCCLLQRGSNVSPTLLGYCPQCCQDNLLKKINSDYKNPWWKSFYITLVLQDNIQNLIMIYKLLQ